MEEKINFLSIPPLKYTALVKITVELWHRCSIQDLIAPIFYTRYSPNPDKPINLQKVEGNVIERVQRLPLPDPLKKEILGLIQPIGLEILIWMKYHCHDYLGLFLPAELYWTPQGTVDRRKTAKELIKDESTDIVGRYRLACIYCLEEDIKILWNIAPQIKSVFNEDNPGFSDEHWLIVFWTYVITGEVAKLCGPLTGLADSLVENEISSYQFAFEHAALFGNEVATEYFFQKLSPTEKEESLLNCAKKVDKIYWMACSSDHIKKYYADVICFLLSQMNKNQQMYVFEKYPLAVLKLLLHWPWQSFFMKTANCTWDFLSVEGYALLLTMMVDKMKNGYKDCSYHEVFGEFWQRSPNEYKRYVISSMCSTVHGCLLSELFEIDDKENLKLIFKNATSKEREYMISSDKGRYICGNLISNNKWDLLKVFVQECITSEDTMTEFKEEFENVCGEKGLLNEFSQFLDDLTPKDDITHKDDLT